MLLYKPTFYIILNTNKIDLNIKIPFKYKYMNFKINIK